MAAGERPHVPGRLHAPGQRRIALSGPAAQLSIGGLQFTKTSAVAMESEELRISLDRVTVRYQFKNTSAAPVDLTVAAGEVVGLFGPLGSGRTELLETIFGSRRPDAGRILVDGRPIDPRKPADAVRAGIGLSTFVSAGNRADVSGNSSASLGASCAVTPSSVAWAATTRSVTIS